MGDDGVAAGEGVGDEKVVRRFEKGIDRGFFVALRGDPGADFAESGDDVAGGAKEEPFIAPGGPGLEVIIVAGEFIADLFDAEDPAVLVGADEPVPERGAEVEAVVSILRLDEDIRIDQVRHQATPNCAASVSKTGRLAVPSMR